MEVFLIPIGLDRYELYCETSTESVEDLPAPRTGIVGKLRHRFTVMLRAAEDRQRRGAGPSDAEAATWWARQQERVMAWVAERIAEQRLLWNLRRETAAVVAHPHDMRFEDVIARVRQMLQRDYERHRVWLVVDSLGLIGSAVLMPLPGPNLVAYFFAFRVVGHWLSMRGAAQGLHRVAWTGRICPPLTELRAVVSMEPVDRQACVDDVATRLSLPSLRTFFERVAISHP